MAICISTCIIGVFALDEKNKILAYELFEKNPEAIAKRLTEINGCKDLFEKIMGKFKEETITEEPNKATEYLRENFRSLALKYKFVKSQAELNKLITEVNIAKTKIEISLIKKRDKLIIQAVSALSDMDKILNAMAERLREWYGFHYPELSTAEHERYAELIAKFGERKSFEDFKGSVGMDLEKEDIEILKSYAKQLKELYILKKSLEKYLESAVSKEMPNLSALAGALLTAKLLALAGSLEKLAKMPSSTIQLLGSEKALFRFLKAKEGKPPKHGILFLHPDMTSAPKEQRGRIARLLASKLTLAARADFYSKHDISEKLKEDYKKKLEEIRKVRA